MRKKMILRLGLVGVVATAGGASAFAVGCSGDDNGTNPPADSGADGTGFPDSSSDGQANHDSATDSGDAAPPPPNAKLTLVHAGPGIPAFRVCFGLVVSGNIVVSPGFFPLPNNHLHQGPFPYLGIFPGTGGTLADLGVSYANLEIAGFIVNAEAIAGNTDSNSSELDCSQLIGTDGHGAGLDAGGLALGTDYFALPQIPKGTLTPSNSFLLALEGCEPGISSAGATAVCGSSYNVATGNIGLEIYQLDNSAPATTSMGVQFLHASSAWDGVLTAAPLAQGGLGQAFTNTVSVVDVADGGAVNAPVAAGVNFGDPVTPDAAAPQMVSEADYASLYLNLTLSAPDGGPLDFPNPDGGGDILLDRNYPFPFGVVQALSGYATTADGGVAGPLYIPGAHFVAIWVGDPTQPMYIGADGGASSPDAGGSFNTASPHFLMLPSDPVLPASN